MPCWSVSAITDRTDEANMHEEWRYFGLFLYALYKYPTTAKKSILDCESEMIDFLADIKEQRAALIMNKTHPELFNLPFCKESGLLTCESPQNKFEDQSIRLSLDIMEDD